MKIGLDLRLLSNNSYSYFILNTINSLIKLNEENNIIKKYNIYTNDLNIPLLLDNVNIKNIGIKNGTIKEQTSFLNVLKNDNNDLMIFFDHHKPILYKGEYYTIIHSLKDIYYQNFNNFFSKFKYLYLFKKNLKNSSKIICFDLNSKDEFIEMLNIEEKKIDILKPFFINLLNLKRNDLKIDIRSKYNIKNDFLIYSGGDGIEKNVDKLINAFYRLNKESSKQILDLVILGDDISSNIHIRNLVIERELQKNIHFLGEINTTDKSFIYENSLGVIFPSLYESFPFKLSEALFTNKPLLASNLDNIKNIMGDKAYYFSPISINSIVETIKYFINSGNKTVDYTDVLKKYTKLAAAKKLLEIIN